MRHATLLELAERDGIRLPDQLVSQWPPQLSAADEKGWFRFQRLYDVARSVLRTEGDVRRLVLEAAEDDVHDGGGWLEIQVDPSGYAARFGGVTAFTDLVLDAVRSASEQTGLGMAVVIAANRTRHPLDARTLARLAGQYAGRGVVGFGLSNDERRGSTADFASAFRIAERAGLRLVPHAGELRGPEHITDLPRRAARPSARPRCPVRRGPAAAGADRRLRRRAGDLPGQQRRAGRLLRPVVRAAADPPRGRRHDRARRGRPVAVRLPPARPVRRHARRPRPLRRAARRAGTDVGARLVGAGRRAEAPVGRHRGLAAAIDLLRERSRDDTAPFTHQPYGNDSGDNPFVSPSGPASQPSGPDYVTPPAAAAADRPARCRTGRRLPASRTGSSPAGRPAYGAAYPGSLDHKGATTSLVLGIVSIVSLVLGFACCFVTFPGVFCAPFAWVHRRQGQARHRAAAGRLRQPRLRRRRACGWGS